MFQAGSIIGKSYLRIGCVLSRVALQFAGPSSKDLICILNLNVLVRNREEYGARISCSSWLKYLLDRSSSTWHLGYDGGGRLYCEY